MFNMRALSHEDTEKVLDLKTVISKVEEAYVMKHREEAMLWPMIFHEFEAGVRDMDIKSGVIGDKNVYGLKLVSWFGSNEALGLPALVGTVMLFDGATGALKALLSGEHITTMRTGSAGAIGAKYLERQDSKTLLMVGTGHQAALQIAATLMLMPSIEKVYVWNPIDQKHAERFKAELPELLKNKVLSKISDPVEKEKLAIKYDVELEVVRDIEVATGQSDIIITATPSRKALIKKEWVKAGTHFSCIGSDMSGKQEIDEKLFACARVFTDDITQSISVGESEIAVKTGLITADDITSEIGAVITGDIKGRLSEEDITIYDSTGIALQDLITANYAVQKSKEMNVGTEFKL